MIDDIVMRLGALYTATPILETAEGLAAEDAQAAREIEDGLSFAEAMRKFRKL